MKKILTITIAAAAMLSLASCQKEGLKNTERIISGSFINDDTKTTLDTDGITPLWSVGDVIRVLDGTSYEDITLASGNITDGGRKITFVTTLTGTLYAVYPASATTMTNCSDGNITFTVPAIQDGTFGSANICVASGDDKDNIYFSNATAVVEMNVANGVVYANMTTANKIAGEMTVTMGSKGAISSSTTTTLSSNYIFVSDTPSDSKFYMAVAPVETGAVTITCNTSSKSGSTDKTTKTLDMDKIYAMDLSGMTIATEDLTGQHGVLNGQEYVIIKAKYDGNNYSYLKWATQNLAVTASGKAKWNGTNYVIGDYFQWAAYDGYVSGTKPENLVIYTSFTNKSAGGSSDSFTFKSGRTNGFRKDSKAPYCNGTKYTKYTGTGEGKDGKTKLELSDDVANIVFGGTWRMPTGGSAGELSAMRTVTYWAWDDTDKGDYVFKPGVGTSGAANERGTIAVTDDKTKALLFFPAAGRGGDGTNGTILSSAGSWGMYWSSTLYSSSMDKAYRLSFSSSDVNPESNNGRCYGFSVRPVSN